MTEVPDWAATILWCKPRALHVNLKYLKVNAPSATTSNGPAFTVKVYRLIGM